MFDTEIKDPHPVDLHVGRAIRRRRRKLGMSQHDLATLLGVSYQQVQKYETSGNRISASRLFDVARALNVPVAYFFLGLDDRQTEMFATEINVKVARLLETDEGAALIDTFPLLTDPAVRRQLVELIRTIGRSQRGARP